MCIVILPGQYYDEETGLHYNYHRYYDPTSGRYLRADPIGLAGFDPNLYGYCFNNPIYYFDDDGLEPSKNRTGNMRTVISRLRQYKGNSLQTFKWASKYKSFGYAKTRYVYSENYGYIDLTHFFRAAEVQNQYSENCEDIPVINRIVDSGIVVEMGGIWNEIDQTFSKDKNVRKSAWSYEDIPSNAAGVEFAKGYDRTRPFYKQVSEYLKKIGVKNVYEIKNEDHYKNLPKK